MSDHDDHADATAESHDHAEHQADHDEHAHDEMHGHDVEGLERVTSPMQTYSMREVGIGFAVLVVGLVVAFAIPLLAA